MTRLTITAKGQVTLKQELLEHLGVGPGERIEADKLPDGRVLVRAAAREGKLADFIGCLSHNEGPKLSIEEINKIARQGWAKEDGNHSRYERARQSRGSRRPKSS